MLLDREFRKRAAADCDACFVSLPFRVGAARLRSPDWDVVPIGDCPQGCRMVLDDLVSRLQQRFRLEA